MRSRIHFPARLAAAALVVALTAPAPAPAATPDNLRFLICAPGGPDLKDGEQEVIQSFFRFMEERLGMLKTSIDGTYLNDRDKCAVALKAKPGALMLSPDLFVAHEKAEGLVPVAQVRIAGATRDRYYLMTAAEGGATELAALKGAKITGSAVGTADFIARATLDGRLGAAAAFRFSETTMGLRAVRAVLRGKADAVLLDGVQYRALQGTPFEKKLQLVYTSDPLPTAPICVARGRVPDGFGAALADVLSNMANSDHGRTLIKTFGIDGFERPSPGAWDLVRARINRGR